MTGGVRALVVVVPGTDRLAVEEAFGQENGVVALGFLEEPGETASGLADGTPDVLVIACAGHSEEALEMTTRAARERPERPVVVLSDGSPNGFVRRAFAAGADDLVLVSESSVDLRFALEKAVARKRGPAPADQGGGSMVAILGPKGGTGKTVTASNLAVSLANEGYRAVLVDLDLQFGDVGLTLALSPDKTIYDLATSGGALDAEKLEAFLVTHKSGARALLAPIRPDHAGAITPEFVREVLDSLRETNDYVIVDTPPDFTPEVIAAIDASSHICIVGMLDSLSLKNTKIGLETLELMGYNRDSITLVLNRADSRVGITHEDVVEVIGRMPDVLVPSDADIPRSINAGKPIVMSGKRTGTARAFRMLAACYLPAGDAAGRSPGRRGRWRRGG
jgi:pilus assembly protein CpaE